MTGDYVPPPGEWSRARPAEAGMSAARLAEAVEFALAHESDWPYSLFLPDGRFIGNAYVDDQPPHDQPIGIVRPRGPAAGMVLRHGRIVAQWGDVARPDTTFSVAKSYLGLLCGIAVDRGLIRSVDDPVWQSMPPEDDGVYASAPERSIFALGGGSHLIWVDQEHELVTVARWIERDHCDGLIARVLASLA